MLEQGLDAVAEQSQRAEGAQVAAIRPELDVRASTRSCRLAAWSWGGRGSGSTCTSSSVFTLATSWYRSLGGRSAASRRAGRRRAGRGGGDPELELAALARKLGLNVSSVRAVLRNGLP